MNDRLTNRRDFLQGKAAARAVGNLLGPTPAPQLSERRAENFSLYFSRNAMATEFQVIVDAEKYRQAPDAAMAALDRIEELEDQLSIYRAHSEVSAVNREAAVGPKQIEAGLWELLSIGVRLWRETGGAFDMTSGPLTRVWGFHQRRGKWPDEIELRETLANIGSDAIELDEDDSTIQFTRPGIEINLGAIGKGWALDRAAECLDDAEVEDFVIQGGKSSVLVRGAKHGQSCWTVGLMHPLIPQQRLGVLNLSDVAMATSGCGNQYFHHQGRRLGHILDPRTGFPSEGVLSATILAPTATEADALATAMYVMGVEQAEELLQQRPELGAVFVVPGPRSGSIELIVRNLPDDCWSAAGE
ncbi:MAG: FAD:protein FMN transferase [Planctomycetales bacterium]|nr:FAD:protein FMN transferase [Planctomycetales bacterium]